MTLIECFTASHIDNIAACLRLRPEKLIMVGRRDEMSQPIKRYEEVLRQRGLRTRINPCDIQGKDLGEIRTTLEKLILSEQDCVIDLTGGDELVTMAAGAVLASLDSRQLQHIRVQKFDHKDGVVRDCIHDNRPVPSKKISLSVEELIRLHGGRLYAKAFPIPESCRPSELDGLWSIVSSIPKEWNDGISYLNEFERRAGFQNHVYLPLDDLRSKIKGFEKKEKAVRMLLEQMHDKNVITDRSTADCLDYTYHSPLMRYCTLKAGNVLEVKTLLEGRSVLENGAPFFHDSWMSARIDWDGDIQDEDTRKSGTYNEIDVILMHGTTPLFISCKNGSIGDELYKLNTVASFLGGPYARKLLIATNLDPDNATTLADRRRAWDMDILLEPSAATFSKEDWRQVLKKVMQ